MRYAKTLYFTLLLTLFVFIVPARAQEFDIGVEGHDKLIESFSDSKLLIKLQSSKLIVIQS